MAFFAVSYDLVKRKDYPELWEEMARLGAHKALLSLYLLNLSNDDPKEVRDHFAQYIDSDDRLLVIKIDDAASLRCFKGTNDWIATHCP